MRLLIRVIGIAFFIFIISLLMKNKDVELQINYFGLVEPLKVAFWEVVTLCIVVGFLIAALGDFVTQIKWIREKRQMVKTHKERHAELSRLNDKIGELEAQNRSLKQNLDQKSREASEMQKKLDAFPEQPGDATQPSFDPTAPASETK